MKTLRKKITKIFEGETNIGVSKSGNNYNHRLLWDYIKPRGCNKPYNYYPRGRVEINSKNIPIIYVNCNIDNDIIEQIVELFELNITPKIHYDGSNHYKCHWILSINNKKRGDFEIGQTVKKVKSI